MGLPVVVEPEPAPEQTYSEWEGAVIDAIESTLDVNRSDAQGIVEAQQEAMQKSFDDGLSAEEAAALIGSLSSTRKVEPGPEPEEETVDEQPEAVQVANDLLVGKYDDMNPSAIADLIEPVFDLPEDQYLELMEKVDAYATELAKKAAA